MTLKRINKQIVQIKLTGGRGAKVDQFRLTSFVKAGGTMGLFILPRLTKVYPPFDWC